MMMMHYVNDVDHDDDDVCVDDDNAATDCSTFVVVVVATVATRWFSYNCKYDHEEKSFCIKHLKLAS